MYDNCSRNTCPCCGYNALGFEYDPCLVCHWIHDLGQEREPDMPMGPNGVSLREAQTNFASIGLAVPLEFLQDSLETRLRGYERDPNWKPLPPASDAKPWRACACCGYVTVGGDWDTCRVCFWEVDPAQAANPDLDGANPTSLRAAQSTFRDHGVAALEYVPGIEPLEKRTVRFARDPEWKAFSSGGPPGQ